MFRRAKRVDQLGFRFATERCRVRRMDGAPIVLGFLPNDHNGGCLAVSEGRAYSIFVDAALTASRTPVYL